MSALRDRALRVGIPTKVLVGKSRHRTCLKIVEGMEAQGTGGNEEPHFNTHAASADGPGPVLRVGLLCPVPLAGFRGSTKTRRDLRPRARRYPNAVDRRRSAIVWRRRGANY